MQAIKFLNKIDSSDGKIYLKIPRENQKIDN